MKNYLIFTVCFLSTISFLTKKSFAQDKIVAIVNNDVITQKDLNEFKNFMRMQYAEEYGGEELDGKIESMSNDLLEKLIDDKLILQQAKKSDIKVDPSMIESRIEEIKKRYGSESSFQEALTSQGLVQADLEARINEQILMYRILNKEVTEKVNIRPEEVTNFYENNKNEFLAPEEWEFVSVKLENEDLAKSVAFELKRNEKLTALASRYPLVIDKLSTSKGGSLRADVEEVLFKLKLGEVSDPINVEGNYFIFILENIHPTKQLSLGEVHDKIHFYLFGKKRQEKLTAWLDELKKQSYIKIR